MSREEKFDFVYSCHSLEHFSNPSGYFDFVGSILSPNGVFFLDVPNVHEADKGLVLDEYFYDKHRVYFDPGSLDELASQYGMEAVLGRDEGASIIRAFRFNQTKGPKFQSRFKINSDLIKEYQRRMIQSRTSLTAVVQRVSQEVTAHNGHTILFGAGRATDALVKYGKLTLNIFDYVVDNYLGQASRTVLGREIITFHELDTLTNPLFVVSTKSSTLRITSLVRGKFPNATLLLLADLFELEEQTLLP